MSIALIGKECSGRHTILNELLALGYDTIPIYTTLPDYGYDSNIHVTDEEFCKMIDNDEMLEWEAFESLDDNNINYTGTKISDYLGDNKVVIINNMGSLHTLISYCPWFHTIYIRTSNSNINKHIKRLYNDKLIQKKIKKRNKKIQKNEKCYFDFSNYIFSDYNFNDAENAAYICKCIDEFLCNKQIKKE